MLPKIKSESGVEKVRFTRCKLVFIALFALVFCSAAVLTVSSEVSGDTGGKPDPLAFFTGKVVQSFSPDKGKVEALDLSEYIDRSKKTIKSTTEELNWDYGKGFIAIDTPKSQGITGFLSRAGRIELDDVIIESYSEYASILVISLDGKPLKTSEKILVQTMTEEKPYGWKVNKNTIEDMGSFPTNIKKLDATLTLKNRDSVSKITVLDENGYSKEELNGKSFNGNYEIKLAPDALYTIIE